MKSITYLVLFSVVCFTQFCCDRPCKNISGVCNDSFESLFRIINKSTRKDLVYGPDKIYDNSKIKLFSTNGIDTSYVNYQPYRLVKDGYDSVLYFRLTNKVDTIFMRLNNSDIDTLVLTYGLSEGRCCSFNSIRTIGYNNTSSLPNYNGTVELRK